MPNKDHTALSIWLHIAKISARLEQEINGKFKDSYGQSLSRFDVLSQFVKNNTKQMRVSDLSKELIASKGNISRLLDRMENDGLITRKHSTTDRRSVTICITNTGHTLFKNMVKDHHIWITNILISLPQDSQTQLNELLKNLQSTLRDNQ